MSLFSLFGPRHSAPAPRRSASVRLGVEALEDRTVPAAAALGDLNLAVPAALVAARGSAHEHSAPWKLDAEGAIVGVNEDGSFALAWGGTSTLIGRYTATASMFVAADGQHISGTGTYTAANGDEIYFTYNANFQYALGTQFPNPGTGLALITGGTGRFAGASGEVSYSGALNADLTFTVRHDDGAELHW